ncbi:MAG: hypothetical protein K6G04_00460 [Lachnospiraceae bacterium]|nr:hypothetical protein [Lachnospiraceae bacterium]
MKIWFKEWSDNHLIRDVVIEDEAEDTRTHKVFRALENACEQLDLSTPIWLEFTIQQFKRNGKARFTQDSFMEEIPFDFLEIHVIEED